MPPYPCGSSSSLSLFPVTPSNFSSQYSKPAPAGIWPERTSLVDGFQAITALARAPPAGIAKPLDHIDRIRLPALSGQPGINQYVAKLVRERIRQQSGQPVK